MENKKWRVHLTILEKIFKINIFINYYENIYFIPVELVLLRSLLERCLKWECPNSGSLMANGYLLLFMNRLISILVIDNLIPSRTICLGSREALLSLQTFRQRWRELRKPVYMCYICTSLILKAFKLVQHTKSITALEKI